MHWIPDRRRLGGSPTLWLCVFVIASALGGACSIDRERTGGGVHPTGFADEESPDFHGIALKEAGYPLDECRICHGKDDGGGAVGVSCLGACHSKGVEACDTCHGADGNPLPLMSGAHAKHLFACESCHSVPQTAHEERHPNGATEVIFTGLAARSEGAVWNRKDRRCVAIYCHGGTPMAWDPLPEPLDCEGCHASPPQGHERWLTQAAPDGCVSCHPIPPDERHMNGSMELADLSCNACHGSGPLGMPPPSLGGSTSPGDSAVGAHLRHVDPSLSDHIGKAMDCGACHPPVKSVLSPGHLDISPPADVIFVDQGDYQADEQRCVTGCHWNRAPGPQWTDNSGAERACDACHGFPPLKTRAGTAHPNAPDLPACLSCHTFEPSTHVDGHVDFQP